MSKLRLKFREIRQFAKGFSYKCRLIRDAQVISFYDKWEIIS